MAALRAEGKTLAEVGEAFGGLTKERVRQLVPSRPGEYLCSKCRRSVGGGLRRPICFACHDEIVNELRAKGEVLDAPDETFDTGGVGPRWLREAFGEAVRDLRLEREYSQAQLGLRLGRGKGYASTIERGVREPKLGTLCRLAEALGVTLTELVSRIETKLGDARGKAGEAVGP